MQISIQSAVVSLGARSAPRECEYFWTSENARGRDNNSTSKKFPLIPARTAREGRQEVRRDGVTRSAELIAARQDGAPFQTREGRNDFSLHDSFSMEEEIAR